LAARLTPAPADASTGPYIYTREQAWLRAGARLDGFDTERWRQVDGSGRTLERHQPGVAALDHEPTNADRRRLAQVPVNETVHSWGSLPAPVEDPVPTDVNELAAAIAVNNPRENGPLALITGLADVAGTTAPNRSQRATVLRLLATIPAISIDERDRDAAGRPGVTVGLSHGGDSRHLTFDPETGELLAYRDHAAGGVRPGLFAYRLYLGQGRTATDRQPPAPAPA